MNLVWNGRAFSPGGAVSAEDRGLLLGDGLFETIRLEHGRPRRLSRHLDRLRKSALAMGLTVPFDEADILAAVAAAEPVADLGVARLTLTRGSGGRGLDASADVSPTAVISVRAYAAPRTPARLFIASATRNEGALSGRHKTLSYADNVAARRQARDAGFDEAVMLNGQGHIACAAAANIFWIQGRALFTPSLSCGALNGVTRACVLKQANEMDVRIGRFPERRLFEADAVFLTNALMGVRAVSAIGDRKTDADHDMVAALRSAEAAAGD